MGRTILGMLIGVVTMMFTVYALEFLGHALYPPPSGLDPKNPEHLQMIIAAAPTGAMAMLVGRYGMIVPILALAGSMAAKRRVAPSLGTFPTTGPLFSVLLVGVIVIVGALTFFPALALGPLVEQLLQNAGKVF